MISSIQPSETPRERLPRREPFRDSGILVIDKPAGMTSMDVIRNLRTLAYCPRVGHGGTLDPFATGVLPILFNDATKASSRIMEGMKEYRGVFYLGLSYDTQDMTGQPLHEEKPLPVDLTVAHLQKLAQAFVGDILQRPPQFSAIKRAGRPLYDYARRGEVVEVEPRPVFVESFEVLEQIDSRRFTFCVRSAKGVYVRTLIYDLGQAVGVGGVLQSLQRTQAGPFLIEEAVQLSTLRLAQDIRLHLKPIGAVYGGK